MSTQNASHDGNRVTTLIGVDNVNFTDPTTVAVDPVTHQIQTSSSGVGGGDGAILDGVSSAIKATVLNKTNSNPLTTAIVDSNGDQITSFGGGTQYTDAGTPPLHPLGGTIEFNNSGSWATVGSAAPLPVSGTFFQATQPVSGTFFQATQPVSEADGVNVTLGAQADAKSTATDTTATSAMSVLKQISASVQLPPSQAVTNSGTFAVQAVSTGNLTHNNAAPAATNLGVLAAVANVCAPVLTEGDQVLLSTDLSGALRTSNADLLEVDNKIRRLAEIQFLKQTETYLNALAANGSENENRAGFEIR